jgi:cytochrome d ubiquinol oxidase subunit II
MADPVTLASVILVAGLLMYALFGGADFGGGIWTALAFGPRAREQREALFNAIGPVWETNHVWLIFVVVTLFTAFPSGFGNLFVVLMTPLVLALVGINFRGAAFAFRHFGRESKRETPLSARVFEIASVLTPFTLGLAVSAAAAGRIVIAGRMPTENVSAWLNPFTILGGAVGMAICAYLAPVYMTVRVTGDLQEDFRKESLAAGLALGILTSLMIPLAHYQAPLFAERLFKSWPMLFVMLAILAGVVTETLLWLRRYFWAQLMAGATIVFTMAGFVAALHPDILIGQLTLRAAAAPHATLVAFLTVLPIGALVLVPSLVYLYWTFRGEPSTELPPEGKRPLERKLPPP